MWKIFGFLLAFCALLLAVLWLFETVFLDRMYKSIRRGEMQQAITLVEENIDSPQLREIIMSLAEDSEILVTPVHEFEPPDRPAPGGKPPLREALTQTQDFTNAQGETVTFVFYAMISPVNATISTIQAQLLYVTVIMIVLAVALAFVIAKTVARPIEQLNYSAKRLAAGDYDTPFSGQGYREIQELSDTLHHTAQELARAEALRRELLANISHDLRTPLALIYSHAEMMQDFPQEITAQQAGVIMEEAQRLSRLVDDILDLSRLETGTLEVNWQTYSLTGSVCATLERVAALVQKDGYTLVFEPEEEVFVRADENKITQVVYNLLTNAIHYSGEDKTVVVRQVVRKGWVRMEVEDFGEGILPEHLPYIWDRYYKIDKAHKRAIAGTGLGLSIVKKILQLHQGRYGAESRPGQGSVFWFALPITN